MKNVVPKIKNVLIGAIFFVICLFVNFNHLIIPVFPVLVAILVIYVTGIQRKLIKTKPTPIDQITEGVVKIEGIVNALTVLETPFFKEPCIGYSYESGTNWIGMDNEYQSDAIRQKHFDEHVTSSRRQNHFQDFYLTDATGKIKVITSYLNISSLPGKSKIANGIKHTERTLKNGDLLNVLGNAVKNSHHQFELMEQGKNPLIISTPAIEGRTQKAFRTIKHILPYGVLMYIAVNYFLFFAPIKIHLEKNTAFLFFNLFGMPLLFIILSFIGSKKDGFGKLIFYKLAAICFGFLLFMFPLLCLLLITETEFYRILCIWASVFFCTTLAVIMNYKKLDEIFHKK